MEPAFDPESQGARFDEFVRTQDAPGYLDYCRRALAARPDDILARLAMAQASGYCGQYDTRLEMLRALVADHPRQAKPNVALGLELLERGRFAEGWPYYRHRNRQTQPGLTRLGLTPEREWQGQNLAGKVILVRREQGLGDTVHFVRNVIALQRRGAIALVDAQGAMRRLLGQSPALGHVLTEDDRVAPNFWIRTLDLVPAITPGIDDVRWPGAYVAAPADGWLHSELAARGGLRVGLAWAGSAGYALDAMRSMRLRDLAPLAGLDGCRFYSLMPDTARGEISQDADGWVADLSGVSQPFDRLASVIAQMDVVVSVCTSIAHLAGAMGKPTLLMLSKLGEWRWGRSGGRTPWYPSMRLFRQRDLGNWGPVVDDVRDALAAL